MLNRKGQSILEYALIIAVIVAGLLVMQHYVKRGFAGRLKSASDDMGEQFDPHVYTGEFTVNQSSETRQTVKDRATRTQHLRDQISKKTGKEDIAAWAEDEDLYSK